MKKKILLCLLLVAGAYSAFAQQATRMRINEVLVTNKEHNIDDYGMRSPWIELFNSSYNTVNIGGCYLTDDINNKRKYMIPKGDVLTKVQARQHVLFWADNLPTRGTFHINFTLDSSKVNKIYFINSDGVTVIDSLNVPVLPADVSWGRLVDGEDEWVQFTKITPSTNNKTLDTNEKLEKFQKEDPAGSGMTITSMGVVFLILILLSTFFYFFGKGSIYLSARRKNKSVESGDKNPVDVMEVPGEVFAAISLAIHQLNDDTHDFENTVLTIVKTRRAYSPWSSKIYGLRQTPDKK